MASTSHKRKQKRQPARKPRRNVTQKASTGHSIIAAKDSLSRETVVRSVGRRLTDEEVTLLKNTVARGVSDTQLALFLHVCQRHGLDPFAKQVYCILFGNTDSRTGQGDKTMAIVTGIDGYRKMAARDHSDFAGTSAATFTWFDTDKKTPRANARIPESATVTAYRKGGVKTEATVFWEEYAPSDLTTEKAKFWRTMPKVMLEKCAEARALRKAFPGLGDVFVADEIAKHMETQTESGRDITDTSGINAQGTPVTSQARFQLGRERSQQVLEQKKANLQESIAEHAAAKLDERRAKEKPKPEAEKPAIDVQPTAAPRIVELDLSNAADPIIRGEISEIVDVLQKYVIMQWRGDWWHFPPAQMDTIIAFLDHCNEKIGDGRPFKVRYVRPPNSPATPASTGGKEPPPSKRAAGGTSAGTAGASAEPTLIKGILIRCDASTVRDGKVPTRQVKIDSVFYPCYRNTLFPFLDKHVGQKIEAFIDKRKQVVGLKSLGPLTFDTDGSTPCIDNATREAGTQTLFGQ